MAIIEKKWQGKITEYIYHTQEEADELGIEYKKDWHDAKGGDFILTSDGYVTECKKRLSYVDAQQSGNNQFNTQDAIITASGGWWVSQKECLLFRIKDNRKRKETLAATKEFVKAYVLMRMQGRIDYDKLGRMLSAYQRVPALYAKRFLKFRGVKKLIQKEIEEVLLANGITKDYMIKKWKAAMEIAEENQNPDTILKAFNSMKDIAGLINKQEIKGEFTYYGDMQKRIDDTEKQLLKSKEIKDEPDYQVEA